MRTSIDELTVRLQAAALREWLCRALASGCNSYKCYKLHELTSGEGTTTITNKQRAQHNCSAAYYDQYHRMHCTTLHHYSATSATAPHKLTPGRPPADVGGDVTAPLGVSLVSSASCPNKLVALLLGSNFLLLPILLPLREPLLLPLAPSGGSGELLPLPLRLLCCSAVPLALAAAAVAVAGVAVLSRGEP
jgi:hypothetical protein